jgi:glycine cleavage system H protein
MTALLVLLTAAVLLVIEYAYSKKHALQPIVQVAAVPVRPIEAARPILSIVDGFEVPAHLRYHQGHGWALSESPTLVRSGMDQFAARLIGKIDQIMLPQRGQWIRQGQKVWSFMHNGKKVDMVSPIEGEVADINESVIKNPELARRDPYGEGWLMTVKSPDAKTNFRNLMSGTIVRRWIEESAARLRASMPAMAGAVAQDGGLIVDDLGSCLKEETWTELTQELFLA